MVRDLNEFSRLSKLQLDQCSDLEAANSRRASEEISPLVLRSDHDLTVCKDHLNVIIVRSNSPCLNKLLSHEMPL